MIFLRFTFLASAFFSLAALADGPADNLAENVRRIPPPGIAVPAADRAELERGLVQLGEDIARIRDGFKESAELLELLPDVEIYHKAVHDALAYDEIFRTNEIGVARSLLQQGSERAQALLGKQAPWTEVSGLIVRGYRSKIDGSVQPYGLVIPATWQPDSPKAFRLDTWFHGRGEQLSELSFIQERQRSQGEFAPPNTFVLHLYGRYCNANKFAGEVDLFEALDDVKKHYPIDENRIIIRGFSMGGAACWQFAAHYPGLWAAAAPGAGFSETPDFLKVFQSEKIQPSWHERKLWHLYDCTDYAANFYNLPVVAYSGEVDRQKQAADMMAGALAAEGITLAHIIGPKTAHRYHPDSKIEIERRLSSIAEKGRDPLPKKLRFTTWTLRYNQNRWVTVDGMEQHWERARVDAEIVNESLVRAVTTNVSALTFSMPAGLCPLDVAGRPQVSLDGVTLDAAPPLSDRSWTAHFRKVNGRWSAAEKPEAEGLAKRHGLQGPIDDAFMDSFIMVRPTGAPLNGVIGSWADGEMKRAIEHWRRQFRGEARVKNDTEITEADIASSNLILWGDPNSNALLGRIAAQLPMRWNAQGIHTGEAIYPANKYAPVMIYPNPLNPNRYVVVNSGFTFREYDYLNNARQVPKLPDFAIIDLSQPATSRAPGGITLAGFFDERWQMPKKLAP